MIQLAPDECRVLGVMVEKAFTVPAAYPMTLNAVTSGCNQKNNRNPITNFDEDRVMAALDGLRTKGLVLYADTLGSRVTKFRQTMRESLELSVPEHVVLTELLLRGPQTAGELRSRASRMAELESLEIVRNVLQHMMDRPEPLVQRLPGGRAERFAQLLCPKLHPLEEVESPAYAAGEEASDAAEAPPQQSTDLAQRVESLESEVAQLRRVVEHLAKSLGETDILREE